MKIYQPAGRAREYSPLALNYFKGCDNGCQYCYVPNMLKRFNRDYKHENVIKPNEKSYEDLKKSAEKMRGIGKQILLSFTGDPYCNAENGETRKILEILNFYGHKVAILTKNPGKAKKDIDLFLKFGDRFKIGSTLTFDNDKDSKQWEPGAEKPKQRIDALKDFGENGIKTWASFEPVIVPSQSLKMLQNISGFIDHVKIGKLNNYKGIDKNIDWAKFIFNAVRICRTMNIDFYIKADLQKYNKGVYLSGNEINEDYLNL
jgi:DNA repair photolyase